MPSLIVLVGLPGSGKSTFAKTFFDLKYSVVSSDKIRKDLAGSLREAHEQQMKPWDVFYKDIGDRLRMDVDVVADATFLTRKHRDRAREVADKHKAIRHLVLFKNWMTANLRNNVRDQATHVPRAVMDDMLNLYYQTLAEIVQEDYATITKIEAFQ